MPGEGPVRLYHSKEKVHELLQSLTAAQKTALMKIARILAKRVHYAEADLIQEAYVRVLDDRVWPQDVPVVPFFSGVMRSIAWDWRIIKSRYEDVDVDALGVEDGAAAARIDLQKLFELFDDDLLAKKILLAMMNGLRGEELQKESGLDHKAYETKRTKIRRRLEKFYSEVVDETNKH